MRQGTPQWQHTASPTGTASGRLARETMAHGDEGRLASVLNYSHMQGQSTPHHTH